MIGFVTCPPDKVTPWPQLISKLLVAPGCLHPASDWAHTFLHPVFLFSITVPFLQPISKYILHHGSI